MILFNVLTSFGTLWAACDIGLYSLNFNTLAIVYSDWEKKGFALEVKQNNPIPQLLPPPPPPPITIR